MRLRGHKRIVPSVTLRADDPITIIFGFGPVLCFESDIDEAPAYATQIVDVIEQARRGGGA